MTCLIVAHAVGALAFFGYVLREAPESLLTLRGAVATLMGAAFWELVVGGEVLRRML